MTIRLDSIRLPAALQGLKPRPRQLWPDKGRTLELRLPADWPKSGTTIDWCLRQDGRVTENGQSNDPGTLPDASRTLLWTPSEASLLTSARIPSRSAKKIVQALPYVLEETLLGAPDTQHFVYERADDGSLAVVVTNREQLRGWLDKLSGAGIQAQAACPDILGLPTTDNSWTLLQDGNRLLCRSSRYSGFVAQITAESPNTPPFVLKRALLEAGNQGQVPTNLIVYGAQPDFPVDLWSQALGVTVVAEPASWWQVATPGQLPLNLLQAEFAPVRPTRQHSQRLGLAASLFAIWLVGTLTSQLWEWRQLAKDNDALSRQMVQTFKQTFPDAQAIVDPVLQMERKLGELRGSSGGLGENDLLALLNRVAPALQSTEKLALIGLRYDSKGVTLNLRLPDYQSLDALKNRLAAAGVSVDVLAANSRSDGVDGRILVKAGA